MQPVANARCARALPSARQALAGPAAAAPLRGGDRQRTRRIFPAIPPPTAQVRATIPFCFHLSSMSGCEPHLRSCPVRSVHPVTLCSVCLPTFRPAGLRDRAPASRAPKRHSRRASVLQNCSASPAAANRPVSGWSRPEAFVPDAQVEKKRARAGTGKRFPSRCA